MFNVCQELKCPHSGESGCNYFASARSCPVGLIEHGSRNPEIDPSPYWLFAEETANIDINFLREKLEQKVLSKQRSQEMILLKTSLN